ncbi:hypothetical protein NFI96_010661, partial [Prochilodus magdalenae]
MFFDFSSAFNTIQPLRLKDKLARMQVDPHLVSWITDYLTGRPQYVRLKDWSAAQEHHRETLRVSQTEGKMAKLPCGNVTTGSVTWSRDTNGQREDILNITNGKKTKLISDPDRRYDTQADLTLTIRRVSQSDAGRYYCGGATVELTVTDQTLRVSQIEGTQAVLHCGTQTTGTVTWSRDTNGQRVDILTTTNGEAKHAADNRYSSGRSLALIIYRVSRSDAGTYYCNRATVELTVIPGTDPDSRITSTPASESTTTTTTSTPAPDATTTTATSTPAPDATTSTITSRSASKNVTTAFTSTPAPQAPVTSTAAEGGSKPTNDGQSEDQNNDSGLWKFLVIAAVSCLVVVVLLISWRFFYNRKAAYAVNQNQEHFYETIDDPTLSTQPASNQKKTKEPVYSLATFPGDQTTG